MSSLLWIGALTAAQLVTARDKVGESLLQLALRALVSLAISSTLYGIWSTYIYPAFFSPLRGLPYAPGGHGPLGHSYAKFGSPVDTSLEQWLNTIPNDGLIRVKEAFGGDCVVATSPTILKKVLVEEPYNFVKAHGIRKILRLVLGDGLIVVEGDVHKSQKQILRNSFSTGPIKDLYPTFWDKSVELLATLEASLGKSSDGSIVPFCQWCERVTLDIIGVAAFGEDFDSLNKSADTGLTAQYHELLKVDTSRGIWFLLSFFLPQWIVANIPFWQTPRLATGITTSLHDYAVQLARKRRQEVEAGAQIKGAASLPRPDILSALIKTTSLTESQLADQILTLLAAGHETTSSALAWTAVSLAKDQGLQDRLRAEIRDNISSPQSGDTPKTLTLEKLPLLNAICHETLRLFPTVPFTARTAIKATRVGDILLPKDGQVWLPVWAFNRSPHFWGSNASEFVPDRWITDGAFNNNGGAPSNYAQMTFLHGPRTCIGQGFAKGELRCLLAAIFGRFQFQLAEDESKYIPEGLVTVKPKNGGLLKVPRAVKTVSFDTPDGFGAAEARPRKTSKRFRHVFRDLPQLVGGRPAGFTESPRHSSSSTNWEMDHMDSDDEPIDDDEETGLTDADKRKRRKRKDRYTSLDGRVAPDDPDAEKEVKLLARQAVIKETIVNALLISCWYGFSIGISVFNKNVLSKDKLDFHYPLFFTSFHMIMQFGLAGAVLFAVPSFRPRAGESEASDPHYQAVSQSQEGSAVPGATTKPKPVMSAFFYLTRISPCGAATGLDIGLGNMSLQYITLTFYTMCKSSVLGFVLLFALLFRLEKPSWKVAAIILTMAFGVIMMVFGETAFHVLGFFLVMTASFFSGFRWSLTQILLVRNPATSNPFSSIFFLAPIMFLTLIVFAFPLEGFPSFIQGCHRLVEQIGLGKAIGVLLLPGLLAFLMTASEFALLKRTSVVTLSVCGIFKEVLTILTAAGTFGDKLTAINISGLVVTICSIAVYNVLKFRNMRDEAKKDALDKVHRESLDRGARDGRRTPSQSPRIGTGTDELIRNSLSVSSDAGSAYGQSARQQAYAERQSPQKRVEDLE